MRLEATAVGGNDLRRRLDVSDEFENAKARVEEARGDSQGSTSQSSGREGKRRELRTPPVVEDIIAGALVGAVTGAVAGAGSGAALGGAGNSGFAGAAGGAASGGALGLTSGAVAGAAMATANPDVAAAGVGAAGVGAAAGVAAVLNRVEIVRPDQYGRWPSAVPPYMDQPSVVPRPTSPSQVPAKEEPVYVAPPAAPEVNASHSGEAVSSPDAGEAPARDSEQSGPGMQRMQPDSEATETGSAGQVQHKHWKRASLQKANNMLSAEIEANSGEVVAKALHDLGLLLFKLRQLQAASEAAIAQATEETLQRAKSFRKKAKEAEPEES
ncbi:unnamed protein product [Effrenium voratum]|nr:unnamed protein product [Effrenium voratum]